MGRSCPGSPADTVSDSKMVDRNRDRRLSVRCLQFRAHNTLEMTIDKIAGPIVAGNILDCRGFGMSSCS